MSGTISSSNLTEELLVEMRQLKAEVAALRREIDNTPASAADNLLTTGQAAAYINRGGSTLYQWRAAGKGPPWYRIEGRIVYWRPDLDEWIAGCMQ